MTILNLVDARDPILHNPVESFDPESVDMKQVVDDMFETMYHYKGVGLSANQVGLPYRMFIMGTPETELVFINPILRFQSGDEMSKRPEASYVRASLAHLRMPPIRGRPP